MITKLHISWNVTYYGTLPPHIIAPQHWSICCIWIIKYCGFVWYMMHSPSGLRVIWHQAKVVISKILLKMLRLNKRCITAETIKHWFLLVYLFIENVSYILHMWRIMSLVLSYTYENKISSILMLIQMETHKPWVFKKVAIIPLDYISFNSLRIKMFDFC